MNSKEKIKYLMVSCSSLPLPRPRSYQIAKMLFHIAGDYRLITSDYPTKEKLDTSLNDIYAPLFKRKIIVKENINGLARRLIFKFVPWARMIPDDHVFWINEVCKRAKKLKAEIEPEVIVAFGKPHTDLIIGMKLKEIFQVPLVIHLSDPWVDNPYVSYTGVKKWANSYLEAAVIKNADLILLTNEDQRALVMEKYSTDIQKKSKVISHCFDEKLYGEPQAKSEKFIIRHIGNLYGQRSPDPFLRALKDLASKHPEITGKLVVEFYGQIAPTHQETISSYLLEGLVKIKPSVSYLESLRLMAGSDLLLLIDAKSSHNIFFPSKLVDYMGAKINILGITSSKGPSAKIINSYGGHIFQHEQVDKISEHLSDLLCLRQPFTPNLEELDKYSVLFIAQEFEKIISTIRS